MKRVLFGVSILLFAVVPAFGQTAGEKKATIAYLQKLQNKDGSFRPSAGIEKSSLRATSAALRALKYFGGDATDRAAVAGFVKKCHDKATGGFSDEPGGKPSVALTAVGLMALVELKVPTEPYEAGAIKYLDDNVKTFEDIRIAVAGFEALGPSSVAAHKKWAEQVEKMADAHGLFGKGDGIARDTGGAVVALFRLGIGINLEAKATILRALNEGQRKDGGFGKAGIAGSDLESSYRVMRCYHMLKKQPDKAAQLREFVAKCRNADGGYGVEPGKPSAAGSTYFAAIILHWLDEK